MELIEFFRSGIGFATSTLEMKAGVLVCEGKYKLRMTLNLVFPMPCTFRGEKFDGPKQPNQEAVEC